MSFVQIGSANPSIEHFENSKNRQKTGFLGIIFSKLIFMLRSKREKCWARDGEYSGRSFDHICSSLTVFMVFTPIYAFGHFADFQFGCFLKVFDAVSCFLGVFRGGEHESDIYFQIRIGPGSELHKKSRYFSFFSHLLCFLPIFSKNRLWNLWICWSCF